MRKNSQKNARINAKVQRELADIIRNRLHDPRIGLMTSVVSVYVAPDLKTCKAYISVLGSEEEQERTMEGLHSALGFIRRELASSLNLRNTPEITFIHDQSIGYGVDMIHRIETVSERDAAAQANRGDEAEETNHE